MMQLMLRGGCKAVVQKLARVQKMKSPTRKKHAKAHWRKGMRSQNTLIPNILHIESSKAHMSVARIRILIPSRLLVALPRGQIFLRDYYLRATHPDVSLRTLTYLSATRATMHETLAS